MACDSVVVVQPAAGGVAIERRFNLAGVVIGAIIQIQNVNVCTCVHTARVCACCFPYYAFTSAVAVAVLAMTQWLYLLIVPLNRSAQKAQPQVFFFSIVTLYVSNVIVYRRVWLRSSLC